MKRCSKCGLDKSHSQFYTDKGRIRPECKSCFALATKERRLKNPQKFKQRFQEYYSTHKEISKERVTKWRRDNPEKFRTQILKRTYGINASDYDFSKCEICGRSDRMHVDHDHSTGKVRGILCSSCNLGLGHFRDDTSLLEAAIGYLNDRN